MHISVEHNLPLLPARRSIQFAFRFQFWFVVFASYNLYLWLLLFVACVAVNRRLYQPACIIAVQELQQLADCSRLLHGMIAMPRDSSSCLVFAQLCWSMTFLCTCLNQQVQAYVSPQLSYVFITCFVVNG